MTDFPLLYIDPGTGSMLFSILISLFAVLYFASRAALIKIKIIFAGKKSTVKEEAVPFVFYSEGKQYWNTFKPIVEEFERREIPLVYYTSASDDSVFDFNWKYVKAEYIGEGNRAFSRMNLLLADVCLMTTPGLDVFQLKKSKGVKHYSHILHMINDATLYKRYGLDYFDSVLLSGDYQKADIRYLEKIRELPAKQLITIGSSYLDVLKEKINTLPIEKNHEFTVLVSPSWGVNGLLSKYGSMLIDPLTKTKWHIIIRPHPQSKTVEKKLLSELCSKYKNTENIEWDFESDNIYSLSKADVMISDFSSITLDYAFLRDKPFLSVISGFDPRPYDAGKIPHQLYQFEILPEIGYELKEEDFCRIEEVIKNISDSSVLHENRSKIAEKVWQYQGEAGKRAADFLVKIQAEICGQK